ncbi:tRNA (adenosine(37)-N6)-dimethylallyltransferase MiaA [Methyloceanibacter caenitepidi]|uniref:tRNA dimethylallyltransferase n=1 Tax=Methyloceanibacter caenitepidi TaxID=1384459 RepID=A0A0A8K4X4_9HYPH|nr:tRNA (adenosine(37)-N6)-dimethylallyltransferase MiaA [Methyloceanibacter caenitepidi]BAQ17064.1 tRNA delta(2)-isopentenylpyrophosphate transferase [Methyloceanibacter caenitepidi]
MFDAVLIAGPTASGKSAAALALADRLGGAIVNADSMQVYRELEILTARPSAAETARVPHHLYGTVPGREAYSVGRWAGEAATAIEQARAAGHVPILVGGTGLYFMALLRGLSPVPDIPGDLRQRWRTFAATAPASELHAALADRDPLMAARLDPSDTQRLVRALEVVEATGVSLAEWQETEGEPVLRDEGLLKLVVAPERDVIYAAIDARFDSMLERGALAEVEALTNLDLDPGLPIMRACGVPELTCHLAGAMTLDEAAEKAKTSSRRYAKRQMTWARRFMADWTWVPNSEAALEPGLMQGTTES